MIDDMVLDKFLHSPLLENDNIAVVIFELGMFK
ncbi:hypothetical protein T11_10800 [Trichinella zimbabwensis]|uniref:Uncharacterized protein n=1 Tax=Trichinella zimbabwensis TaxID=268475 RepID=A0A0V1GAL8_9BILA|nr:hypothetical protein T11_10800 [Trichinella zimbabwensis]